MGAIHIDEIMSWAPCEDYPRQRIVELIGGDTIEAKKILKLPIPSIDKFWFVLREPVVPRLSELTIDLARMVLPIYEERYQDDNRLRDALALKREQVRGGPCVDPNRAERLAHAAFTRASDDTYRVQDQRCVRQAAKTIYMSIISSDPTVMVHVVSFGVTKAMALDVVRTISLGRTYDTVYFDQLERSRRAQYPTIRRYII